MIYILVTCSLIDKHPIPKIIKLPESYRIQEYALGIEKILELSSTMENTKVILIEKNPLRRIFLTNQLPTPAVSQSEYLPLP